MQAWQSVQVANESSNFHGQAGFVIRTEMDGDKAIVFVHMDVDGEVHSFGADELKVL